MYHTPEAKEDIFSPNDKQNKYLIFFTENHIIFILDVKM